MTWDFFTWLSILVLIAGSLAVFVWFLRDVRVLVADLGSPRDKGDPADKGHLADL